jgi:L-serine dehydratase
MLSVFDLYTIGIGPSSSHTVGPMRAARLFAESLQCAGMIERATRVRTELFGSLGLTGKGHGSDKAILMGLSGETPEGIDPETIAGRVAVIRKTHSFKLLDKQDITFEEKSDLVFHRGTILPRHSNGLRFTAFNGSGMTLLEKTYYSVGGGFVIDDEASDDVTIDADDTAVPYPYSNAAELLNIGTRHGLRIHQIVMADELIRRDESAIRENLRAIWKTMRDCVAHGCVTEGTLPGGLKVPRRAPALYRKLVGNPEKTLKDPLSIMDWVNLYALAVSEENAAGGRVVTAPTNGAAGIIPAVLHYLVRFTERSSEDAVMEFLLTAGAVGILYKRNASISGAEVGCQGEVGVACSMAAAGLASALGGTNEQVENAAEIGMEHNLGLTCDPVGGLVQIPCIERNAMGAMKAINAARIALSGDGTHKVPLDKVIRTMMETGRDMRTKYKETSQGGLATNVVEC